MSLERAIPRLPYFSKERGAFNVFSGEYRNNYRPGGEFFGSYFITFIWPPQDAEAARMSSFWQNTPCQNRDFWSSKSNLDASFTSPMGDLSCLFSRSAYPLGIRTVSGSSQHIASDPNLSLATSCWNIQIKVRLTSDVSPGVKESGSSSSDPVPESRRKLQESAEEFAEEMATIILNALEVAPECSRPRSLTGLPIIFIPGAAGSVLKEDVTGPDLELWPLAPMGNRFNLALNEAGGSNTRIYAPDIIRYVGGREPIYGPFIEKMKSWGYVENRSLFLFPYDWRLDNFLHADGLNDLVEDVLRQTNQSKVILIAHSMGGIVARAYMAVHGTDKVSTFITMGTPHLGSPKPYYALTMGYTFGNPTVNQNLMKVIVQNMPALYQLLPREPFVEENRDPRVGPNLLWPLNEVYSISYHSTDFVGTNYLTKDDYKTSEDWPWTLNKRLVALADSFHKRIGRESPEGVETYTIIGYGRATLSKYVAYPPGPYDPDLPQIDPKSYGFLKADGTQLWFEPNFDDGDGTVPLWSAEGLQGDTKFYIQNIPSDSAEHGSLPLSSRVQNLIRNILEGTVDTNWFQKREVRDLNQADTIGFYLHSSANLHVYDAEERHLGMNDLGITEEEIPGGAFLNMDGLEYAAIFDAPNTYNVRVVGAAAGEFTLGMTVRSGGKTLEMIYPEVKVETGTIASFDVASVRTILEHPPTMTVVSNGDTMTVNPMFLDDNRNDFPLQITSPYVFVIIAVFVTVVSAAIVFRKRRRTSDRAVNH